MFKSKSEGRKRFYHFFRISLPRRMSLKFFKWGNKMTSTNQYDLVDDDEYDIRIPLHPDEAFQYGISFHAKVRTI